MELSTSGRHDQTATQIQIRRRVYDEYLLKTVDTARDGGLKHQLHTLYTRLSSCSCSWHVVSRFLVSLAPIFQWLPKYSIKENLVKDLSGGLTVGIMHIPQGLAFAMLASLPPVTGLYTAIIPVLLYMIMGTSRTLSVGSFAVICLMVAQVCEREVALMSFDPTPTPGNSTGPSPSPTPSSSLWTPKDAAKLEIAITLSFLIGIIQIVMGAVHLGVVATYLSDPLISGFTTGSAVLVVISQMKHILGVKVPQFAKPFVAPKGVIHMLKNLPHANVGSIITGVLCLAVLIGLKHVNERFKNKLKVPIPGELLVVVVGTAISYGAAINKNFGVSILGFIPKGLPPLSVPNFSLVSNIFSDAFVIAVVIFATNISISKMFAKKHGYLVDPNQELIAYGAGNFVGSFFSCFPICNALARSVVEDNLAVTQLCSIVVIVLILLVLLFIAPLFFHLPKAILAAVVIANLIGLLKQFSRFPVLWRIDKPDAIVWFVSCFGVILMGVDVGLGIGLICALFVVVVVLSRSNYAILGRVTETELYRDTGNCPLATEVSGIKVLRFESTLYFGNVERFRNALYTVTGLDPNTEGQPKLEKINDNNGHMAVEVETSEKRIHTVIIDGSSFTFIDSMALHAIPSLMSEFKKLGVDIYLAGCSSTLTRKLTNSSEKSAITAVDHHALFPSIHDAVMSAMQSR
ncbi:prestin-like [Porites lutea]|uniref:prestin-like n=1 Tax=Porites lutea TaxID=51062 RepID=UPI003CC5B42A